MIPRGSTPIKNKILIDIFACGLLSRTEMRIVHYIIRYSWGFCNKPKKRRQDWTPDLNFVRVSQDINMNRAEFTYIINRMVRHNKLKQKGRRFQFNEHYDQWVFEITTSKSVRNLNTNVRKSNTNGSKSQHKKSVEVLSVNTSEPLKENNKENIKKIMWFLWQTYNQKYEELYNQPCLSDSTATGLKLMRTFYEKFNNQKTWHKISESQKQHTLSILLLFFKVGPQKEWDISPRNLIRKIDRLQRIQVLGKDGVYDGKSDKGISPVETDEMITDKYLDQAMKEITKNPSIKTIAKCLDLMPDKIHHKLQGRMDRRFKNGFQIFEKAYKLYNKGDKNESKKK